MSCNIMHLGGLMLQSYSKLFEIVIKIAIRWTLSSFLVLDASIEDLHNPAGPLLILWHVFWVEDTISARDLVYLLRCCLLHWLYRCLSNNRGRRTGGEVQSWGFLRQVPSYLGWFALVREISAGNPSSVLCILFMQSMNGFLEHFCEHKFHHLQRLALIWGWMCKDSWQWICAYGCRDFWSPRQWFLSLKLETRPSLLLL